ncbi:RNA polymerase sigma factor [Planctomycetota bacterium]
MNKTSDHDLLTDYAGGNDDAFSKFYQRHASGLYAYLCSSLKDRFQAEEAMQAVFVNCLRSLDAVLGAANIKAYIYRIARNQVHAQIQPALKSRSLPEGVLHMAQAPQEDAVARENMQCIENVLSGLPHNQRQVIVLHIYSSLTFREIAAALGDNINTVMSRYQLGLKKIKEICREC